MNPLEALQLQTYLGTALRMRGRTVSGVTGTMAAGLASGSAVYTLEHPSAAVTPFLLAFLHLHFICLTAFTTATMAGRRLALRRGSGTIPAGGLASGGAAADVVHDVSAYPLDQAPAPTVGRIATTTGLTMTGITLETPSRGRMMLPHVGAANSDFVQLLYPNLVLAPGQLAAIIAPQAFDAGGTWQLSVTAWGVEA